MATQLSTIITGIDHPAVAVEDVAAMTRWYCEVLGYDIVHFDESKPVALLKAADGTCLEVMPRDDTPRPQRTTWTPGWSHLALRVSDLDRAIAELDRHQVQWTSDIVQAVGGGRLRSFSDPENNMWQIVERSS